MPGSGLAFTIARALAEALEPLRRLRERPEELGALVSGFGWPPPAGTDLTPLADRIDVVADLDAVLALADRVADGASVDAAVVVELTRTLAHLVGTIDALGPGPGLPAPYDSEQFWSTFPDDLVDHLLLADLDQRQPVVVALLEFAGVISEREIAASGARGAHVRRRLEWASLGRLLGDPAALFAETYGWGTPGALRHEALLRATQRLLGTLHRLRLGPPSAETIDDYYAADNVVRNTLQEVSGTLVDAIDDETHAEVSLGVYVLPVPADGDPGGVPEGLVIGTRQTGALSAAFPVGPFRVELRGGAEGALGPRVELRPGGVSARLDGGAATVDAALTVTLRRQEPIRLIGEPDSHRITLGAISAGARAAGPIGDADLVVDLTLDDLAFVVQTSEGDGFLRTVLGTEPRLVRTSLQVGYSTKRGLLFNGALELKFSIGLHLDLGPMHLEMVRIEIAAATNEPLRLDAGVVGSLALGPLALSVDGIGVRATFAPRAAGEPPGNFGRLDVDFGFKPPAGVGVSLDATTIRGGGYLYFDPEQEEYAGALELVFSELVALKAIGLLTTRMPDGSSGFSLLLIITAEFGTGIQLGFGFTLLGVGGLIGLNRTVRLQPLAEGVRTGAVNGIMFPRDVIANAPRIVSDLRAIFPPQQGTFLIGPMARLGWGTPTLVSLSLGIIIEVPGNVAILGVLRIALPADDVAVVVLQANFVGAIEFDTKRLYLFASLFDSRVLFITLEGEIGVLAAFGDDANFVMSVGGFHPRYVPPPLPFPSPRRLALSILNESWARIGVDGYFAVTSNSVQFGARAELYFGFSALSVEGAIGFDALLQFSPFHFVVEISASFSVKVFGLGLWGIRVRLALEGPTPWRAQGSGGISLFFFDIDVDFDVTWGEERDTALPPIEVMPLLAAELVKEANWRASLPAGSNLLVTLRALEPAQAALVLHPVGTLRVSQRAVPLDLAIDRVGNQAPSDADRFTLAVAEGTFAKRADVSESFAPAQFRDYDDATKLSKPAYEPQHAGLELSVRGQQLASGAMVKRVLRYELVTVDTGFRRRLRRFFAVGGPLIEHLMRGASASRSTLSKHERDRLDAFGDAVAVRPDGYAVALQSDNRAFDAGSADFASEATAQEYLAEQLARDPGLAESLHVIPRFELAA